MTCEELLAKISDLGDNCLGIMAGAVMSDALRAVVELHKPIDLAGTLFCANEFDDIPRGHYYPCPTIQAIEKALQ